MADTPSYSSQISAAETRNDPYVQYYGQISAGQTPMLGTGGGYAARLRQAEPPRPAPQRPAPARKSTSQALSESANRSRASSYAPNPGRNEAPFDAVTRPAPQEAGAAGTSYVVQRGDNLSKIARRTLGDPNRWSEIASLNRLDNPDQIDVGQRLTLPGAPQAQQADVSMPSPRMNPRRGMPTADQVDDMTRMDAAGNYVRQPPQQAPQPQGGPVMGPADIGRAVADLRASLIQRGAQPGPALDNAIRNYEQSLIGQNRAPRPEPRIGTVEAGSTGGEFFTSPREAQGDLPDRFDGAFSQGGGMIMDMAPAFTSRGGTRIFVGR